MGVRHGEVHRCFGASGGVSSGGVLDDLHVDAEGGGVLGEVLAVAAVDPGPCGSSRGGGLVERSLLSWRGYTVRIVDDTGEELGTYTSRVSASATRVGAEGAPALRTRSGRGC